MSTDLAPTSSNVPATSAGDSGLIVGLEDLDATDVVMPRIKIVMEDAEFEDNLSNERFTEFEAVILGVVKQRVMWPEEVDDDAKPLCKSYNHETGHPGPDFPWKKSGFDQADEISCAHCPFKEWDSHPSRPVPWCTEQYVFPLLREDDGPALLTIQRSGIKPAKSYMSSFLRQRKPMFTCVTKLSLTPAKKGSVKFAIPNFAKGEQTPEERWDAFAKQFLDIRNFLHTPPSPSDDEDEDEGDQQPASSAAPLGDDEDVPF